jgi:hypothetical protein
MGKSMNRKVSSYVVSKAKAIKNKYLTHYFLRN